MDIGPTAEQQKRSRLPAWLRVLFTALVTAATDNLIVIVAGLLALAFPAIILGTGGPISLMVGLEVPRIVPGVLMMLAAWLFVRFIDRGGFRDLGVSVSWARAMMGALIGVGVALIVEVVAPLIGHVVGFLEATGFDNSSRDEAIGMIFAEIMLVIVTSAIYGLGVNTLWFGYLLRSLSGRPVIAIAVVTVIPAVVSLVPSPVGGFDADSVGRAAQASPAMIGAGLVGAVMVIALRSVWPAVGIEVGTQLGLFASAESATTAAGTVRQAVVKGVLLAIGAVVTAFVMDRRRWQQFAANGPFAAAVDDVGSVRNVGSRPGAIG
jgi:hypothetical protein